MRKVLVVFSLSAALLAIPVGSASAITIGGTDPHPPPVCIPVTVKADVAAHGGLTLRGSALGTELNASALFSTNASKTIEVVVCLKADVGVTVEAGAAALATVGSCTSIDIPVTVRGGLTGGGVEATISAKVDGQTILLASARTRVGALATLSTSIDADACVTAQGSVGVGI